MKPYCIGTKTKYNYSDCHPRKGFVNWWEYIFYSGSKTATRMKVKNELRIVTNENELGRIERERPLTYADVMTRMYNEILGLREDVAELKAMIKELKQ